MQMSAIGVAGIAHQSNGVSALDMVAYIHQNLVAVGILGGVSIAMVDHHMIPPAASPGIGFVCPNDHSVFRSDYLGSEYIASRNIKSSMVPINGTISKIIGDCGKTGKRPEVFALSRSRIRRWGRW